MKKNKETEKNEEKIIKYIIGNYGQQVIIFLLIYLGVPTFYFFQTFPLYF